MIGITSLSIMVFKLFTKGLTLQFNQQVKLMASGTVHLATLYLDWKQEGTLIGARDIPKSIKGLRDIR